MNDIMKIAQPLEDRNILLKGLTKTIEMETKKQKGGFLSILRHLSSGKGVLRAGYKNKKSSNSTTSSNKF